MCDLVYKIPKSLSGLESNKIFGKEYWLGSRSGGKL